MRALATYIMRGRMPAILATAGLALAALLLIPVSWPLSYFSGAAVVLVTLVQGPKEGLVNIAGATLLVALITGVTLGQPILAIGYSIFQWLPVWILALVLHQQRSLEMVLFALGAMGLVLISSAYVIVDNPANDWFSYFTEQVIPAMKSAGVAIPEEAELVQKLKQLAPLMTGFLVVSSLFGYVMSIFIGRWWQAEIHRPGAFGEEFRNIRLGKFLSVVVAGLVLASVAGYGQVTEVSENLLLVAVFLFMFQGLAIAHSLNQGNTRRIWLTVMYLALFLIFPYGILVIAMFGLMDNGFDIRGRLRKS